MNPHQHVPLDFKRMPPAEQVSASREFLGRIASRRSVRFFSSEPVPFEPIENAIRCASLAPDATVPAIAKKSIADVMEIR